MSERKYSLAEIDRMRAAIQSEFDWNWRCGSPLNGGETMGMHDERVHRQNMEVENRLRTYLMAGTDPAELESSGDGDTRE